ncbi:hypothetical protein MNBD_ALPHA01-2257 [hydrothermal vent metagenome]|uniref:Uncharacterized protein n=1 Tax=hydrothermal vent metagenome TaxID=652676 RepID=A0A3B0RS95_9ZZZZ
MIRLILYDFTVILLQMKYILFFIITGIASGGILMSPSYATESEAEKYRKCMALVQSDATEDWAEAVTYANDWIFGGEDGFSGGVPAGHCKALGLLAMGQAADAAGLLERLADDLTIAATNNPEMTRRNNQLKTDIYGQAALAWKVAGEYDKSYMAYSSALSSALQTSFPANNHDLLYELYLARGTLQIMRRQYKSAIEDLTLAIESDARRFEGFLQRAKAHRKKNQFLKARLDLKMALRLAQKDPEVSLADMMLEQGILFRATGQKLKAKLVWQKIINQYPDTEYARLARTNIGLLTVE